MATYSLAYAQEHLADLFEQASRGEEVVVANDRGMSVKLSAVESESRPAPGKRRQFGRYKGLFSVPDDFFAPLTEEELEEWERPI